MNKFELYLVEMLFDYEKISDSVYRINNCDYQLLPENSFKIDEYGEVFLGDEFEKKFVVFEFGKRWYWYEIETDFKLNEFRYIGNSTHQTDCFLGVRSGVELMNGVGLYETWLKKAKFLGIKALAICEKNTLTGVIGFQKECKKNGIKSIFGMTITIEEEFDIKLYVKNFIGWQNLVKFNSKINVDKEIITTQFLEENHEGLFVIADPKTMKYGTEIYYDFYQLDSVTFLNIEKDKWYLRNLEKFIKSSQPPISITDAFYLEAKDYKIREVLWMVNKNFDDKTNNQYFKSKSQWYDELTIMFDGDIGLLIKSAITNEKFVADHCNFNYDITTRHLPKYKMTEDESKNFKTNKDLFLHIVLNGMKSKGLEKDKKYIDRVKEELNVLVAGDVIDYFLILWDIMSFAEKEGMNVGNARGSAGGSLIAYLMNIIKLDPIKYGLLFERFLNPGRMGDLIDCNAFEIKTNNGIFTVNEGSLVRIIRNNKEFSVHAEDLLETDEILKLE